MQICVKVMKSRVLEHVAIILALIFSPDAVSLAVASGHDNAQDRASIGSGRLRLGWKRDIAGYVLDEVSVKGEDGWKTLSPAICQNHILYSPDKPGTEPETICDRQGREIRFPEPEYRYVIPSWEQNISPVSLNTAGESIVYFPETAEMESDGRISFHHEDNRMEITQKWSICGEWENDIRIDLTVIPKTSGFWSISSPSVISSDKNDFTWATVPGIFQGNAINHDFIQAYAYGQGIPDRPVVTRERTATTLTAIITDKDGMTSAVTAVPGTGRDPWEKSEKTHAVWKLGLSVMNRDGEFTPTMYHPVLGEEGSFAEEGDTLRFSVIMTLQDTGWHQVLEHAINDIYRFADVLKLKDTDLSLTQRVYDMLGYLADDSTSMWRNCCYKGTVIGAQDYRGGVYGAEKDAMKNSDYGAMWMLAKITGDSTLISKRLPYALNFKIMQQNRDAGDHYGASAGQYYLYKSRRFTEEWGPYTEPIATAYYMLMDMGNILLFEPWHENLKAQMRDAADWLLGHMHEDGHWEVAYGNSSMEPMFTDISDLRPTFYGMFVAYSILKDEKYLEAAEKGADWYIRNAVAKGHFTGVCGDTRFAPDFATAQGIEALLELYDMTGKLKYRDAALDAAGIYMTSIYTHPIPSRELKEVNGVIREDWEISQAGLGFEHGGTIGSANHRGPILLASHAGLFVRLYAMTADPLFLNMARAAAIGRDAFVDKSTGVASYYWDSMDHGAGPFPHHAWWQIGWIYDYLISEAWLRSDGKIYFPGGFITPKVGPHKTYGFAPGKIYGNEARLIMKPGLVDVSNQHIEYLTAYDETRHKLYIILMNNDDRIQQCTIDISDRGRHHVKIKPYGIRTIETEL